MVENCRSKFEKIKIRKRKLHNDGSQSPMKNKALADVKDLKHTKEVLMEQINLLQKRCSSNLSQIKVVEPIQNVLVSSILQLNRARQTNHCLGLLVSSGYITSKICCQATEIFLTNLETNSAIEIETNEYLVEDNICLFNITPSYELELSNHYIADKQNCSILMFDIEDMQFNEYNVEIQINQCHVNPCKILIDPKEFQNKTILNGTSIVCNQSSMFGIVLHSKSIKAFSHNERID